MAVCKECGKAIKFLPTAGGKLMPVDCEPTKGVVMTRKGEGTPVAQVLDVWTPHWATCTAPDKFRRRDKNGT